MKELLKSKYITVVEPANGTLLKVTMKCACCLRNIPSIQIMPERLAEWRQLAEDTEKFQPLCKPCARAHKKWHRVCPKLEASHHEPNKN